jgi:hypothetical protein
MTIDTTAELGADASDEDPREQVTGHTTHSATPYAGLLSIGAGAVHAAAAGIHAEHAQLARLFVVLAALQIAAGLAALLRPNRLSAYAVVGVNAAAVAGWITTRVSGIGWIDGLESSEAPQFADSACAALGAGSVAVAVAALAGWRMTRPIQLAVPGLVVAAFALPAMMLSVTHVHADDHGDHGDDHAAEAVAAASVDDVAHDDHSGADHDDHAVMADAAAADHDDAAHDDTAHDDTAHDDTTHDDATHDEVDHAADHDAAVPVAAGSAPWPRAWDPSVGLDLAGVEGVTPEQQARAEALVEASLRELPKYADPADAIAAGYASIGDAGTGSEHYIRGDLIEDDVLLDATAPESLVYAVDGDQRTLAGAMYIASQRPADDPSLTEYAGPLMTWHKHDNLCWDAGDDGQARVVGLIDADGNCARGVRAGGANPMVHVWITPHPCGVFAALEGVGAGTAAVPEDQRVDMCSQDHADHGEATDDHATEPQAAAPYDPTMPIDLSGFPGVTPQQQAAAENLVAVTVVRLPQWSDYRVAEAAGFRSIGDGGRTGAHEHFIQWDWINDDVILDPDAPESLVYEVQADGSRKLVSAMYMLSDDVGLDEVPDIGGDLMQWHIHDNLCFSSDPEQPRVAGITDAEGNCNPGLTKFNPAAMIHVWITPHRCGPFAALEGVGAGQILEGEERLCDHLHGA